MSDADRVTHYEVIRDTWVGALVATVRSEIDLVSEPSSARVCSGDRRPVGWMAGS